MVNSIVCWGSSKETIDIFFFFQLQLQLQFQLQLNQSQYIANLLFSTRLFIWITIGILTRQLSHKLLLIPPQIKTFSVSLSYNFLSIPFHSSFQIPEAQQQNSRLSLLSSSFFSFCQSKTAEFSTKNHFKSNSFPFSFLFCFFFSD